MTSKPAAKRDQEMLRLAQAGASLAEIGERYGVTRERVRQILERVGYRRSEEVCPRRLRRQNPPPDIARIRTLAAEGLTRREIATAIGAPYEVVADCAARHGINIKTVAQLSAPERARRRADVCALRRAGATIEEIATRLSIAPGVAHRILKAAGLTKRRTAPTFVGRAS